MTISADFKKSDGGYALDLKGVILLAGMEFDFEFKKTSDNGAKSAIIEWIYKSDTGSIELTQLLLELQTIRLKSPADVRSGLEGRSFCCV